MDVVLLLADELRLFLLASRFTYLRLDVHTLIIPLFSPLLFDWQVWKTVVTNTPRVLREVLPVLIELVVSALAR